MGGVVLQHQRKRSAHVSQFRWFWFFALSDASTSTERQLPEPSPDWALRNMQLIYAWLHTNGRRVNLTLYHTWHCAKQNKEISVLPGFLYPQLLSPCRALLLVSSPSSPASVYPYFHLDFTTHTENHKSAKNIFYLDKTSYCCARCLLKCRSVLQG